MQTTEQQFNKKILIEEYQFICDEINELDEKIAELCGELDSLVEANPKHHLFLDELGDANLINVDYIAK